jgi:murein DD-endopeptidase MepM/ murein hydrolase activator NlpD
MRSPVITALLLAGLAGAPAALGADGGAAAPSAGGGARYKQVDPRPPARALLKTFVLTKTAHGIGARAPRVRLRVDSRARYARARVWLRDRRGAMPPRTVFLGRLRTGRTRRLVVPVAGLPEGRYSVRVSVRDGRGRAARRARGARTALDLSIATHAFPVAGPYSFGGAGARFGAARDGHIHQGQDVLAALGTPLVAPSSGMVTVVQYQASGAGHYVVMRSDTDAADYVFMHMRERSVLVSEGQRVATGQQLGQVGSTGRSSGPHLHFEIWTGGGWQTGGHPVDPLPYLRSWAGGT